MDKESLLYFSTYDNDSYDWVAQNGGVKWKSYARYVVQKMFAKLYETSVKSHSFMGGMDSTINLVHEDMDLPFM